MIQRQCISQLYNDLLSHSSLLVLDARPPEAFHLSHVRTAFNVCLHFLFPTSSDLATRSSAEIELALLEKVSRSHRFKSRRQCKVVVYDDEPWSCGSAPAVVLARTLANEGVAVFVLDSGYRAFCSSFPFKCTTPEIRLEEIGLVLPEYPSEILPGLLYLGTAACASDAQVLRDLRIFAVLNCAHDVPPSDVAPGVSDYHHVVVDDRPTANISQFFDDAWHFAEPLLLARRAVLVHCRMGISRSTTIVLMILMRWLKVTLWQALTFVRRARTFCFPNHGFMHQLTEFEVSLRGQLTTATSRSL
eukprot:gnl/Spiro4/28082_TR13905_c0_g2_i1.p1 gnl/Spiro4/28082_TR13905_c0_g2~~gnl/Spiro4/28082_TR13905_c0_g2_i1.p1  ORF type:complete len:303 (+),score=49.93 gnl/Spiro4/28082_TR13905_c0_g2_i1:101-1009(+)